MTDEFAYRVALAAEPGFTQWVSWWKQEYDAKRIKDSNSELLFPWYKVKAEFEAKYLGLEANKAYRIFHGMKDQ